MTKGKSEKPVTGHARHKPEPPRDADEKPVVTLSVEEFAQLLKKADESDAFLEMAKRVKADFANYQKRIQRDATRVRDETTADFARALLPVVDNLDRAIRAAEQEHDFQALLEGIGLVSKEIFRTLAAFDIEVIDSRGAAFDPTRHEAVVSQETREAEPHTVLDEIHRGFLFRGRLLRPAAVKVAIAPQPAADGPESGRKE